MMLILAAVAAGVGGSLRYWISTKLRPPLGVIAANILAVVLVLIAPALATENAVYLVAGFCGGLSSWSTLGKDLVAQWQAGHRVAASANGSLLFVTTALLVYLFTVAGS